MSMTEGHLTDAQLAERRHAAAARWAGHHSSTPTKRLIASLPDRVRYSGGMTQRTATSSPVVARTLTRGDVWQRHAQGISAIPVAYTGSTAREKPAGGYLSFEVSHQVPSSVTEDDHRARAGRYANVVRNARKEVLSAAEKARPPKKHVYLKSNEAATQRLYGGVAQWRMKPELYPEGTPKATLNRAYNHAALLALHDRGVIDYDFKMDPHLKAELTPTIPLIRYVRRELGNRLDVSDKASGTTAYAEKKPYLEQFGSPFKPSKVTGEMRRRFKPNEQLVKFGPPIAQMVRTGARYAGSGARKLVTYSAKAARGAVREGARLGGNVAGGFAEGAGAGPKGVARAQKVGAVIGGGKLAALPAILGYHPAINALRAAQARRKQQSASPQPAQVTP